MGDQMRFYISHVSAYRYWSAQSISLNPSNRFCASAGPLDVAPARLAVLRDSTARVSLQTLRDMLPMLSRLSSIDLLVDSKAQRSQAHGISAHICSTETLPAGSLSRIAEDIFVATPELCFVQMAQVLDYIDLVRFGYELCGGYCIDPAAAKGFLNRMPISSTERLERYIDRADGLRGVKLARAALGKVADRSASPRETATAIIESLPVSHGGFGLPLPAMNWHIPLATPDAQGRRSYLLDLYWPQHDVAIEYASAQEHSLATERVADIERQNVIELGGTRVIQVTGAQLTNPQSLEVVSKLLAKLMGKRMRPVSKEHMAKRANLLARLLARTVPPWAPGLL